MSNLKDQLIKLGYEKPELRDHLRPVLSHMDRSARWDSNPVKDEAVEFKMNFYWKEMEKFFGSQYELVSYDAGLAWMRGVDSPSVAYRFKNVNTNLGFNFSLDLYDYPQVRFEIFSYGRGSDDFGDSYHKEEFTPTVSSPRAAGRFQKKVAQLVKDFERKVWES